MIRLIEELIKGVIQFIGQVWTNIPDGERPLVIIGAVAIIAGLYALRHQIKPPKKVEEEEIEEPDAGANERSTWAYKIVHGIEPRVTPAVEIYLVGRVVEAGAILDKAGWPMPDSILNGATVLETVSDMPAILVRDGVVSNEEAASKLLHKVSNVAKALAAEHGTAEVLNYIDVERRPRRPKRSVKEPTSKV